MYCSYAVYCPSLTYNLLQLTSGEWVVEEVKAVDEAAGLVYFLGTKSVRARIIILYIINL